jgi:hypothetical protein
MATLKYCLITTIIFGALTAAQTGLAGEIGISAEISKASIAFEDKDTLIVKLVWEGEPFLYQMDDFPMPTLEKMEILGSSSSVSTTIDSTIEAGEITIRSFRYILQPIDYGTGVISPINLTAKNRVTGEAQDLQTGRLTIEISKPVPRPEPSSGNAAIYILIALVVVFGGGTAVYLVILKRRRQAEDVPADLSYVESLKEIKKESVADKKLFYSRLYRLLLNYLEKERGLAVSGKTGEEIIRIVGEIDDDAERANLMQWINRAQKVKYQPEAPSAGEVENSYNAVFRFFENKLQKG